MAKSDDWIRKVTAAVLLLAGFVLLASCTKTGLKTDLDQYTRRLARALDQPVVQEVVQSEAPERLILPAPRGLSQAIDPITINLLDFLQLGDCELQQAVADKNSSLGMFSSVSRLLAQDVLFISLANRCYESLPSNAELAVLLRRAASEKQATLDKRIWNGILAGPEYRRFWQIDLSDYPERFDSRVEIALMEIESVVVALQIGKRDIDWHSLEAALEVLRNGEAGALVESWRQVAIYLDMATRLTQARTARRPLCFPNMNNPKAEVFRNVVLELFIQGLQKDIAILNRRYYDIMIPLRRIEERLEETEPESYRQFRLDRDKLLELARGSVSEHVAVLEPLMVQCGFLPKSNLSDE
ncbi:MAG: hypothetical protein ACI831_000488 [Candidatus Azotimanducaceae bacterium]|jgi:hypothetical protein